MLKSISSEVSEDRLIRILGIFSEVETILKYSTTPRTVFETAAVKASKPDADYDLDALLSRIKQLEDKIENGNFKTISNNVKEQNVVENTEKVEFKDFVNTDISEIKGKLLYNLRTSGSELLWNILKETEIKKSGYVLTILVSNETDENYLKADSTQKSIESALKDFGNFEISIKSSYVKQETEEIDKETENIKKIFGDDIVIIKN